MTALELLSDLRDRPSLVALLEVMHRDSDRQQADEEMDERAAGEADPGQHGEGSAAAHGAGDAAWMYGGHVPSFWGCESLPVTGSPDTRTVRCVSTTMRVPTITRDRAMDAVVSLIQW